MNVALGMQTDKLTNKRYILNIKNNLLFGRYINLLTAMVFVLFMQEFRFSICAVISFMVQHNLKLAQKQTCFNFDPNCEYQ